MKSVSWLFILILLLWKFPNHPEKNWFIPFLPGEVWTKYFSLVPLRTYGLYSIGKHSQQEPGNIWSRSQAKLELSNTEKNPLISERILNMNLYRWQAASCASFVSRAMSFIKTIKTWLESYYIPTISTCHWKPSWSHMYRDTAFTMVNKIQTEHSDF